MISSADILAYLDEHGTSKEEQMALHFKTSVDMIAMMCERLAEKGRVQLINMSGHGDCGCGGGCACGSHDKLGRFWKRVVK